MFIGTWHLDYATKNATLEEEHLSNIYVSFDISIVIKENGICEEYREGKLYQTRTYEKWTASDSILKNNFIYILSILNG